MINNYELVKSKMSFLNDRSFYFIQLLKRKKENPELRGDSIPVESFYVFGFDQFERMMPHIIDICEKNRARAYVKMNCLDAETVMLEQISLITQEIRAKNWRHLSKTLNSACGCTKTAEGHEKLYLVDLDDITIGSDKFNEIVNYINNLNPTIKSDKIYMSVPTKHGCHLITTGFDMQTFKQTYPHIDIHKDGNTLLYFPECCD